MPRRHLALPRLWLLTDERQGEALWPALDRLPRGSGVVVRHYSLPIEKRMELARRVARRGLFVAFAGSDDEARRAGARAAYGVGSFGLPRLYPVHNLRELRRAHAARAALVLISPVFPTRSHPDARALGALRFAMLARRSNIPVVALGGMTARRYQRLRPLGAQGWAAIDGLVRT